MPAPQGGSQVNPTTGLPHAAERYGYRGAGRYETVNSSMDWIFHIAMLLRTREVKGRRWLQFAYSTPDFLVLGVAGGFPKRAGIVIESDQGGYPANATAA